MVKRKNEKQVEAPKKTKVEKTSLPIVEAKETIFDEYYPEGTSYIKTANGSEKYAKNQHGDEMYLKNENGEPVFAQKLVNTKMEIFFARNRNGNCWVETVNNLPFYPLDAENNPIFPKSFGEQEYAVNENGMQVYPETSPSFFQTYARKRDGHEFAALDHNQLEYYATKLNNEGQRVEYYPKDKDGVSTHVTRNGRILYARNVVMDRPLYEKDAEGNETYFSENAIEQYGQDSKGKECYRKLKNGVEKMAVHGFTEIYAKDAEQNEYYPKDENEKELYKNESDAVARTKVEVPAKTKDGKYFYAKDKNGDEFYPRRYFL